MSSTSGSISPGSSGHSVQHRSVSTRGRKYRHTAAGRNCITMSGGRGVIPAHYVPEDLIDQAEVILQGVSRSAIVKELQRTNLDVNLAVNNLLSTTQDATNTTTKRRSKSMPSKRGLRNPSTTQQNHPSSNTCNCQNAQQASNKNYQISHPNSNCSANTHRCPMSSVHNRYKPVTKKNIYRATDFFHDGIMEYIEYYLHKNGHLVPSPY